MQRSPDAANLGDLGGAGMTAPEDISLNGKCIAMDAPNRTFRMKDVDGTEHPFKWTEPLDVVMMRNGEAKWKTGYYLTVTYNPDTHAVKNVTYWQEGKDKFPREQRSGGGGRPANDKAILFQCLLKAAVELRKESGGTLRECVNDAKECMSDACTAAGVV